MATVKYNPNSPYFETPQVNQIISYLAYYRHRPIRPAGSDFRFVVPASFDRRPDLAAFDLYQTPNLWWIFMLRNMDKIIDPIEDFVTDLELMVPTYDSLTKRL